MGQCRSGRFVLAGIHTRTHLDTDYGSSFFHDCNIVIENGKIKLTNFSSITHQQPDLHYYFSNGECYFIPGLIDPHFHGIKGHDVMSGNPESLHAIQKELVKNGVTGFLPTTMTACAKVTEKALQAITEAIHTPIIGTNILGIHLEGPFISTEKAGAQDVTGNALNPDFHLLQCWHQLTTKAIKLVTIAPEMPGSIEFIESAIKLGIQIGVGHTNATFEETKAAIDAGASVGTHLFNAMPTPHHRKPGAAGALLDEDRAYVEVIADGHHLHDATLRSVHKQKPIDKIILVSDSMPAAGLNKNGVHHFGGNLVNIKNGVATTANGKLAGSTASLLNMIKNMQRATSCSLAEAVSMASSNTARMLGVGDHKGKIKENYDADITVLDSNLSVVMTIVGGEIAYLASNATNPIKYKVFINDHDASIAAAHRIRDLIIKNSSEVKTTVLGLATGGTMEPVYAELVRLHQEEGLDFSHVMTFNLDEYVGLAENHPQSYRHYMCHHLFDHVNIKNENIYLLDGTATNLAMHAERYEAMIEDKGGIDLQLLGIGNNGHIAFNEPGSSIVSRTRVVDLDESTRNANARFFNKNEQVPKQAISMGISTILKAKTCVLLATGEKKAHAINQTFHHCLTNDIPATALRTHPDVVFYLDKAAASDFCDTKKRSVAARLFGQPPSRPNSDVAAHSNGVLTCANGH